MALAANGTHIAKFAARENPSQQGIYTITRAFEAGAFTKAVAGINSPDLIYRRKALLTLREFLGGKKDIAALMGAGAVQSLTQNLFEEDSMCRALAAEAIGDLATISGRTGCIALVEAGCIERLIQLLEDPEGRVVDAAYRTISLATQRSDSVQDAICFSSVLPILMEKVVSESERRVICALQTMRSCLSGKNLLGLNQLLGVRAVGTITKLVQSGSPQVSDCSTGVLALLLVSDTGKHHAVSSRSHLALLHVLKDRKRSLPVVCDAVAGLLNMSVDVEGKIAVIQAGGAEAVAELLSNPDEKLRLQILQAIASLADDPTGREKLQKTGPTLQGLHLDETQPLYVRRHAQLALQSLKWIADGITV